MSSGSGLIVKSSGVVILAVSLALATGAVAASPANNGGEAFPSFQTLRLLPNSAPPAACVPAIYGSLTSRAPDGALCLCHQGFDGKQGYWEQIGTGKACWPHAK